MKLDRTVIDRIIFRGDMHQHPQHDKKRTKLFFDKKLSSKILYGYQINIQHFRATIQQMKTC